MVHSRALSSMASGLEGCRRSGLSCRNRPVGRPMPKQQTATARCGERMASSISSSVGKPCEENGQKGLVEGSAFICVGWATAIRTSRDTGYRRRQAAAKHTDQDKNCRQKRCDIRAAAQASFEGFIDLLIHTGNKDGAHGEFEVRRIAIVTSSRCNYEPVVIWWANGSI